MALIGTSLVLLYTATLFRTAPAARYAEASAYEDHYYVPDAAWLPLFSLGHQEALADLLWIRVRIYYGEEMIHAGRLAHARGYIRSILTLDPDFRAAYHWTGIATFYGPQGPTPDEAREAMSIMDEGCERFPDDGPLQWETGALYVFELAHLLTDATEIEDARERGVRHLIRATQLGAAPPYAALTNASVLMRIGRSEEAASHLEEMYASTTDPSMRAELAEHIEELRSRAFATGFVEENERFEEAWGREMPYAPAPLYDLVGPVPVIDTATVLREGYGVDALEEGLDLTE